MLFKFNRNMLKTGLIFTCLLFVFCGFMPPNAPVSWLQDQTYDFGDLEQGKEVKVVFSFVNEGKDSLYIDNVRTSCGCTSPSWADIKVPPDSLGHIEIFYDADDLGAFSKGIKVYFNGYRKAERLAIEGYVE